MAAPAELFPEPTEDTLPDNTVEQAQGAIERPPEPSAADRFEDFLSSDQTAARLNHEIPSEAVAIVGRFVHWDLTRIQMGREAYARTAGRRAPQPRVIPQSMVESHARSILALANVPSEIDEARQRATALEPYYAIGFPQIVIARTLTRQLTERNHPMARHADNLTAVYTICADELENLRRRGRS